MTAAEEKLAWDRHRCEQLREWRDLTFRRKLESLESMGEFARHVEAMRLRKQEVARHRRQEQP